MLAKFETIGRIGFARVKKRKGKFKNVLHFSLAYQVFIHGKKRTQWNNNFTLRNRVDVAKELFKMGTLVYVAGDILSFMEDGRQENRFIVKRWDILKQVADQIEEHVGRYGDMPPEEYYDAFDESTDSLNDYGNYFRPKSEENFYEEDL